MSNTLMISIQLIRPALPVDGTIEHRFKAAVRAAYGDSGWLLSSDDDRFRAAVGAVLTHEATTEEETTKIKATLEALRGLSAAISGVPVNMAAVLPDDPDEVLPLQPWFQEARL